MAYIYKITNNINGKIYVGKTDFSIEKRFKEHCRDSLKEGCEKRPLYSAMRKYGVENFSIDLLEETNNPEEREIYWIETLESFKNGYNATIGGDGTRYANYDIILTLWKQGLGSIEITKITGYAQQTISRALFSENISPQTRKIRANQKMYKPVAKIDINTGEILEVFESIKAAERAMDNKHIASVCVGKRKTANGFGWKHI